MSSRVGPRSAAMREQRREADLRRRVLEFSRSASTVARAAALKAMEQVNEGLLAVLTKGYVADSQLGPGLARPLLAMPTQPVSTTSTFTTCGPFGWEQDTASAAFDTLFRHDGVRQNVCWAPVVSATCSDATTAGELRFLDLETGAPLVETLTAVSVYPIPAGSSNLELAPAAPGLLLPQAYDVPIHLGVQARVTAGTGTITLAVKQSIGG